MDEFDAVKGRCRGLRNPTDATVSLKVQNLK